MDREGDPHEERARQAVDRAERLREELIRSRIELALLERNRRRSAVESGSLALPTSDGAVPSLRPWEAGDRAVSVLGGRPGHPRHQAIGPGALAIEALVQPRAAPFWRPRRGIAMGAWLLTFYFLFVVLAQEPAEVPGSTLYQGPVDGGTSTSETVLP